MSAKFELIIDSCCDLPKKYRAVEGVTEALFSVYEDGKASPDDFFESVTAHDFYQGMRDGATPSTSQVSLMDLVKAFESAAERQTPIVYLAFSSGLSGAYDAGVQAREHVMSEHPDAQIFVVDLLIGSTPEGLLVHEAFRQREKGLTAEEMVTWAEEARWYVHTMFMVEDLEALRRGGRIPSSVAMAGAKLDVKPLLSFDLQGKLTLVGVARGRKKGLKQMAGYFAKRHESGSFSSIAAIGNSDCPKDAARLKELVEKQVEGVQFLESSIGPTIGAHTGPDMVSICFWGPDRRNTASVADKIANRVKQR